MSDKIFKQNLRELFNKQKYQEIILKIEEYSSKINRPADLSSIIGMCKILKLNNNKNDIISALSDFEDSYNKSKTNEGSIEALCNYITACIRNSQKYIEILNYFKKAKEMYEEAEKNFGYNEKLFSHGVDLYKYSLEHNKVKKLLKTIISKKSKSKIIACLYGHFNNYTYDWKQKDYFEYSKIFKNYFSKYEAKKIEEINYNKNKKIKIGFVSGDFVGDHTCTFFTKKTISNLDKNFFETFGISLTDDINLKNSSLELKNSCDKWLDLSKYSNQEVIKIIQDEKIEILIDLMGLTQANRIEIFNTRISPLQISWLSFCNTVGFSTIDYLIADKNLIYEGEEKYYSEKVVKLPNIWNCHSGFKFERNLKNLPFKKNNYITFGSFNNFLKISDQVIRVWSKILQNVKNSKLILKSSFSYNTQIILDKFKKYGVGDSIEFYDRLNYPDVADYIKLYDKIDIALDTFPYNGVTTTFEALWAGVPVITMQGYNFNSRCGASIMKNGNLEFFLSTNEDEYTKKAVYLSNNVKKLEEERKKIFNQILSTPLFDSEKFSSNLKDELLKIYNRKLAV